MDEFGNISNWPENFFGNEMSELFARAEAEMERRKESGGLMDAVIVDTNVIVIANGEADHASLDCIQRCQQRL